MEKRNVATSGRSVEQSSVEDAISSAAKCIADAGESMRKLGRAVDDISEKMASMRRAMAEDEKADREQPAP